MNVSFVAKLALVLSTFTLGTVTAYPQPSLGQSSNANDTNWILSDFNTTPQNGENGTDGRDGRDGRGGQSQTIFANPTTVNLNLSGEDGTDGGDGEDGEDLDYCRLPNRPAFDITAPNGGNGGRGGRGGNGGNGGALTVYYANLADVRKISVRSLAGRGGLGGRGGHGGRGCECDRQSWERDNRRYTCTDGRDGSSGADGQDGRDGTLGMLWLVNRSEELLPEVPTLTASMGELSDREFSLSRHIWETRQGATSLLAPDSVIADAYWEFVERLEGSFQLVWQANRPIADFGEGSVTLDIQDNGQVAISFPEDVWVGGTVEQQGDRTIFTAMNAIAASEATQLRVGDLAGSGSDLQLVLVDLAQQSHIVATQVQIEYRSTDGGSERGRPRTRYEGEIPAELIRQDYNRFMLDVGKLLIDSRFLQSGTTVEIELIVTRSFAGRSVQQKISWQGEI
jgi:hypothetical protein